jgi:hypothetical protein
MSTSYLQVCRSLSISSALLCGAMACGDGGPEGVAGSEGGATSLSVSFAASGIAATNQAGNAVLVGTSSDTMIISRVQLVLDEVKLKRAGVSACPDSMRISTDRSRSSDDRGCSRLDLGPVLLDLPLSGTSTSPLSVKVPAGTYREIEFELDDVSNGTNASAAERAFVAANPDLRDVSVRVIGTYKGTPFTYTSRPKAEVEFEFSPALEIKDGVNDNVTISLDLAAWFKDGSGAIIAPTIANRLRIDQNILTAFAAYGDRDRNGREDDGRGRGRGRGRNSSDD